MEPANPALNTRTGIEKKGIYEKIKTKENLEQYSSAWGISHMRYFLPTSICLSQCTNLFGGATVKCSVGRPISGSLVCPPPGPPPLVIGSPFIYLIYIFGLFFHSPHLILNSVLGHVISKVVCLILHFLNWSQILLIVITWFNTFFHQLLYLFFPDDHVHSVSIDWIVIWLFLGSNYFTLFYGFPLGHRVHHLFFGLPPFFIA